MEDIEKVEIESFDVGDNEVHEEIKKNYEGITGKNYEEATLGEVNRYS